MSKSKGSEKRPGAYLGVARGYTRSSASHYANFSRGPLRKNWSWRKALDKRPKQRQIAKRPPVSFLSLLHGRQEGMLILSSLAPPRFAIIDVQRVKFVLAGGIKWLLSPLRDCAIFCAVYVRGQSFRKEDHLPRHHDMRARGRSLNFQHNLKLGGRRALPCFW